eukprot:1881477-Amphidinium_carterae.1
MPLLKTQQILELEWSSRKPFKTCLAFACGVCDAAFLRCRECGARLSRLKENPTSSVKIAASSGRKKSR